MTATVMRPFMSSQTKSSPTMQKLCFHMLRFT